MQDAILNQNQVVYINMYICYESTYCNGLHSLIIWDYSLSVREIPIATLCRPVIRTGRLASCKVTIPGLINNYLAVVSENSYC